jgi:protein-arginine kinase activator protein McsA
LTPKPKFCRGNNAVLRVGDIRVCDVCEQHMSFIDFVALRGDTKLGFFICRKCISEYSQEIDKSIREHDQVLSKISMVCLPLKVLI